MQIFPVLLILLILFAYIGPLSKAIKKQQQTGRPVSRPAPPKTPETDPEEPGEDPPASARNRNMEGRPRMTPSITLTEHDDSIYLGSMNAVTGEGVDPCHEEQLAPLTRSEHAIPSAAPDHSRLPLGWTGNDMVRGMVMSEILNRKKR